MILDFADCDQSDFEADICIVGSGIAAYALLTELVKTNLNIIVAEKGPFDAKAIDGTFKNCEIESHPFMGNMEGREFGLGGTSVTWGGQALPLSKSDFKKKDWIADSGWPIAWDTLAPFYKDAESLLRLEPISYETRLHELQKLPALPCDPYKLKIHFSKWSPQPNLQRDLIKLVEQHNNITILVNAGGSELVCKDDKIENIRISSPGNKNGKISASCFVIGSGGIENVRLLLMSSTLPKLKMLGKMFQDHPSAQAGTVIVKDDKQLQRYFNYFFVGKTRMLPKLSLAEQILEREKLLSATSFIQFIPPEDSLFGDIRDVYRNAKRYKRPSLKQVKSILFHLKGFRTAVLPAIQYLVNKRVYTPGSKARVTILVEQEPDVTQTITLSQQKDLNGNPIARIQWEVSDQSVKSFLAMREVLNQHFEKFELGHIEWDPWVNADFQTIKEHLTDSFHHIGATRMSTTMEDGVVDPDCRVHGIQNLFVAGSSVFPTGGHSNPTLTLMALAIRLGQHLTKSFFPQSISN